MPFVRTSYFQVPVQSMQPSIQGSQPRIHQLMPIAEFIYQRKKEDAMKLFLKIVKTRIKKQALPLTALSFLLTVQGCVAALPLAYSLAAASYAMGGFAVYKSVQMTTGGEAEVRFKKAKLSAEDQKALSSIKRLAIYPGSQKNVKLAEALGKSGKFDIITPYSVQKALPDTATVADIKQMTEQEKRSYALKLCNDLNADGIFIYSEGGHSYDTSYWSLKRSEAIVKFQASVFSVEHDGIIWTQEGEIVLKTGSNMPPQDEVDQIAVSAIAEKFLSDAGKK